MLFSAPVEDIPNTFLTMEEMLSPSIRSILEPVSRLLGYPSYDSFMGLAHIYRGRALLDRI